MFLPVINKPSGRICSVCTSESRRVCVCVCVSVFLRMGTADVDSVPGMFMCVVCGVCCVCVVCVVCVVWVCVCVCVSVVCRVMRWICPWAKRVHRGEQNEKVSV